MGPGTVIANRYEVGKLIGRGGMGRVFRAREMTTARPVAIKVLHREENEEPGREDRFKREIEILSRMNHPAVPGVLHWGVQEGELYFISEFVDGPTLRAELGRRGPWPPLEAAALASRIADALAAAHAQGIVHRDVNANNIMIGRDGGARLLDFGIARTVGMDVTKLTTTGVIIGTPGYMSPEQFDSRPVTDRSDIYSLGVVLFEMLTGRLPFTGSTPIAIALQHKTESPPTVRSLRADVPAWLERIVMRCLEKEPLKRYATAEALARDLERSRTSSSSRRRRLPSGDLIVEDPNEQSDWVLVLSSEHQKTGWTVGQALRFEEKYYRLVQIDAPDESGARWSYRFDRWPESDVFRHVVDYEQDLAERAAAAERRLGARLSRWLGR